MDLQRNLVLRSKSSSLKIKLVESVLVDDLVYWVYQCKNPETGSFKGGGVLITSEALLGLKYEAVAFEDTLTEGEVWLAYHDTDGLVHTFVARPIPGLKGLRLWHTVRGTWSSKRSWEEASGFLDFRRATMLSGDSL